MRKLLGRIIFSVVALLVAYLAFGIVLCTVLRPTEKKDLAGYFRPGDTFASRLEGFEQTVIGVKSGWVHTRLEVKPYAAGPPEHYHEKFTENFTVKSGTLSILVDGEKRTLKAGESISIPPLSKHKPFNETDETVVIESSDPKSLPLEFGFLLTQLYGFMDALPNGPTLPQMMLQLSVYGGEADSYIADGPPLGVQKAVRSLIEPTARLLGYREFYEGYRPKRAP